MLDAYYVPIEKIKEVTWTGSAIDYDTDLYNLGCNYGEFVVANPDYVGHNFYKNINTLPNTNRCVVWKYNGVWIAKYFTQDWINQKKYLEVNLELVWERNSDIDKSVLFNQPSIEDLYDLNYEMIWYADPMYSSDSNKIWVYKCHLSHCQTNGSKDMGYVSPAHIRIIRNTEIPEIEYAADLKVPLYDLKYECVWYLDPEYNITKDKVWAVKVKLRGANKPAKDMGYVSPKITYNPALPKLDYNIDSNIPYVDLVYEHVWMVDKDQAGAKDIWAAKITPKNPKGTKVVSTIKLDLPAQLDVIFISYKEPNALKNWLRVIEKMPYAKRINGVKGIVNAHKCAAELATTDMFYVVDGDAYLSDDFDFSFQPGLFDRDCVHVWSSRNPVNDLIYGYGGVKLLPKELILQVGEDNPDMTTSISNKFKVIKKVSNITAFNTDEFNAFRSAFRECAKLSSGILKRQLDRESKQRLEEWCRKGADRPYGEWAIQGALAGKEFGESNSADHKKLLLINDINWLKQKFDKALYSAKYSLPKENK